MLFKDAACRFFIGLDIAASHWKCVLAKMDRPEYSCESLEVCIGEVGQQNVVDPGICDILQVFDTCW